MQIADFHHDDRSDGSGKAGITFIFKDAIASGSMNDSQTNAGGWQSSSLRSWLSTSGVGLIPDDLRKNIVQVKKYTNNVGQSADASSVTSTDDMLWLFSYNELGGSTSGWGDASVYQSEGDSYLLFQYSSSALVKTLNGSPCRWWERNPDAGIYHSFMSVNENGNPYDRQYSFADRTYGAVPGFCI
ncbi:MAG: DUF6273 domain-containing protein [Coriobacteriales bacterium]|nr:DUF6273 domain-containing protein [Coriobacteriales bacterium]